jgi:hypothetical protein
LETQEQNQPSTTTNVPDNLTPVPNAPFTKHHHSRPKMRQKIHPTFAYPTIHETFFDKNVTNDDQENNKIKASQVPLASFDALTSSTRTNFTYPPIEDLTRMLLMYAKTANL